MHHRHSRWILFAAPSLLAACISESALEKHPSVVTPRPRAALADPGFTRVVSNTQGPTLDLPDTRFTPNRGEGSDELRLKRHAAQHHANAKAIQTFGDI